MSELEKVLPVIDGDEVSRSMKPMLAECIRQAVFLAIVDCAMWTGTVTGQQIADADVFGRYKLLPSVDAVRAPDTASFPVHAIVATPGPGELQKVADHNGVELLSWEDRLAEGGWCDEPQALVEGYVSFTINGDDRWVFHVPLEHEVLAERYPTDEERRAWVLDPYQIPEHDVDPGALATNVANRLLGTGGWEVVHPNGEPGYAGNMTTREVFEASFLRPDRDTGAELAAYFEGQGMEAGPIDPTKPLDEQLRPPEPEEEPDGA